MRLFARDITLSAMHARQARLVQEAQGTAQNISTEKQLKNYLWCQTQVINNNNNISFMAPHLVRVRCVHTHARTHAHTTNICMINLRHKSEAVKNAYFFLVQVVATTITGTACISVQVTPHSRHHFKDDHYCAWIAADANISVSELLLIIYGM